MPPMNMTIIAAIIRWHWKDRNRQTGPKATPKIKVKSKKVKVKRKTRAN